MSEQPATTAASPATSQSAPASASVDDVAAMARLTGHDFNDAEIAMMADDGLARAINPAHTPSDGDTMFALSTGQWQGAADLSRIGALAAEVVAEAIVRAVARADSLAGFASAKQTGTVPARMK